MRVAELLKEDGLNFDTGTENLFEMANLRQNRTGVPGTIYISTAQASHAPRVKHYAGRPSDTAPNFSVSISSSPAVIANHGVAQRDIDAVLPQVIAWVATNHEALTKFWFEGTSWFEDEVSTFKASLKKLQ